MRINDAGGLKRLMTDTETWQATSLHQIHHEIMEYIKCDIEGLCIIKPKVFGDHRGYFCETYKAEEFKENVADVQWVQENQSMSTYGVLRGLHFQKGEFAQAKLVRVIKGRVLDVAVDLRKGSPTFGRYKAVELSEENMLQFFVPRGFAHGFLVLSEEAVFQYKVDNVYAPQEEGSLNWDDNTVAIEWPLRDNLILSDKDRDAPALGHYVFEL